MRGASLGSRLRGADALVRVCPAGASPADANEGVRWTVADEGVRATPQRLAHP